MRTILLGVTLLGTLLSMGCGQMSENVQDLSGAAPVQSVNAPPTLSSGAQDSSSSQIMVRARVGRPFAAVIGSSDSVMVKSGVNKGNLDETVK